jgi:twitching motility two-component system response regulator PilG
MTDLPLSPDFALNPSRGQAVPASLLNALVNQQVTGRLTIQNPFDEFVNWQVYLGNGRIHFANSANGSVERLNYLIGSALNRRRVTIPEHLSNDYQYICELWKNDVFSFQQSRSILNQATQEALVQILSLPKSQYDFSPNDGLDHIFLNLDLAKTVSPIKHKIRYWWNLRSDINSPFQRPLVENWTKLNQVVSKTQLYGQHWFKRFHTSLQDLDCLYQIAGKTEMSTLQLALLLRPLIKTGEIKMLPYQEIQVDHRPLVAYVDHLKANQRQVGYALNQGGFRPLALEDPFKALAVLLNQKPNLILINTDLPEMNGYQLCALCRKSKQFKETPILLMGNKDNLTAKIRSKLSGASGFISQPFLPQELLQTLRFHLPQTTRNPAPYGRPSLVAA